MITLTPCPAGFFIATPFFPPGDYIPTQYVYISGTGTPEAALATQVSGHAGDASCTFSVTTVNTHAAGYTVGSASGGIKEASEAARSSIGRDRTQGGSVYIDPAGSPYKIYAPLHFEASYQNVYGVGGLIQCFVSAANGWKDDDCIVVGQRASQTKTVYVTLDSLMIEPANGNLTNYAFDAINVNAQGTKIIRPSMQLSGAVGPFPATGSFNSYISICDDEAFTLEGIANLNGQGLRSDLQGQAITALGEGDHTHGNVNSCFAVGWIRNLNGSMQCTGNVIKWLSGNSLRVSDSVIQGFVKYGILSGHPTGGFAPDTIVENCYFEVGTCTNPDYVAAGATGTNAQAQAAILMQGGNVSVRGATGPSGSIPIFTCSGSSGSQSYDYWAVPLDPGNPGSFPLYIGAVAASCSGTVTVYWPTATPATGPLSWDLLRTARVGGQITVPYAGNTPGGSVNASGSVMLGQADISPVNKFTDTIANATSSYTISALMNLVPFLPFWPGNVVLSSAQAGTRSSLPVARLFTDEMSKLNGGSGLGNGVISVAGTLVPSVFGLSSIPQTFGAVATGGLNSDHVLIQRQTSANGNAIPANQKGQLHFWQNSLTGVNSGPVITLVDSSPNKSAAFSTFGLITMDAADTWIGLDNSGTTVVNAQLAYGAPISVSTYINTIPDNVSWKERLTGTLKSFAVPVQFTSVTFSGLGTPANGTMVYCSDCTTANPCASGGTGAFAKRIAGAWVCT